MRTQRYQSNEPNLLSRPHVSNRNEILSQAGEAAAKNIRTMADLTSFMNAFIKELEKGKCFDERVIIAFNDLGPKIFKIIFEGK